jgi:hypothetical protein
MSTQASGARAGNLVVPVVVVVVGFVLMVVAQYVLEGLSDTSDTWHNIQHGMLFIGGVGVGIGGMLLWLSGRRY